MAVILGLLCALLASAACTGGDGGKDGQGERRAAAQPPKVKKLWELPVPGSVGSSRVLWTGRDTVVLHDKERTEGYDARTGDKRWTLRLPKGMSAVCGASEQANAAGLGALYFTDGKKEGCNYAGVVDLADGRVQWSRSIGRSNEGISGNKISIGDDAVTVTVYCNGVEQFRVSDGKPLGSRLKGDKACAHDVSLTGRHLAVKEDPVGQAKELVPGWIHAEDGAPASFALYEGAATKPLWRTKARKIGDELHGIVSDDPLILDISRAGHRLLQTYDADGKPVQTIGKRLSQIGTLAEPVTAGPFIQGNTLVIGYQRDPALYAYDLDTGKVRWQKRQDEAHLIGVRKDRLLAARQVTGPGQQPVWWLVSFGMSDGKERTIGRIAESRVQAQFTAAWDDERIYLSRMSDSTGSSIVAYPLPPSGGERRTYDPEAFSKPGAEAKPAWRKGDLRPDEVATACEAVSPQAQRAIGTYRKGMPPPVDCTWQERNAPRHAERTLEVRVRAYSPDAPDPSGTTARKPASAVALARKAYDEAGRGTIENEDKDDEAFVDGHRLEGLGDEAKSAAFGTVQGSRKTGADVMVRHRNVIVRVKARTEVGLSTVWGEVPPRHQVEAAAQRAAADVVERLDGRIPERAGPPQGGTTTEVEPVCARLRSQGAALVPGAKVIDTTPGRADGRAAGCEWETDDYAPELTVRVVAIPDSPLTGESAQDRAESEIAEAEGRKVRGLGDEGRLERDTFRGETSVSRTHSLTLRKENLIVYVSLQRWHDPSASQLDTDVRRVAQRILDQY
ncbi:PQQ-binding-like beta-propeller repeat protein [Streptomyces sp. NPDC050418]|uniref:outer membrane protein assembly factor BamB family protein n=1 Tax=Streptomyces sp. NPDC050418 TaxID=3365612 RepID=UPI00378FFCF3